MTKVWSLIGIIVLAAGMATSTSATASSRAEAMASVRILGPNEVIVLRPNNVTAEGKVSEPHGSTVLRSVSRRPVRLDSEGRVIQGVANAQFITIEAQ